MECCSFVHYWRTIHLEITTLNTSVIPSFNVVNCVYVFDYFPCVCSKIYVDNHPYALSYRSDIYEAMNVFQNIRATLLAINKTGSRTLPDNCKIVCICIYFSYLYLQCSSLCSNDWSRISFQIVYLNYFILKDMHNFLYCVTYKHLYSDLCHIFQELRSVCCRAVNNFVQIDLFGIQD